MATRRRQIVRLLAVRCIARLDVLCAMNQGLTSCDLWSASLSSAMYCRSVLGKFGRDVVPGFGGESIEKGPVFVTDPAPREPPDRAIGRVAEQAPQNGTVGRPALGIQHAQMKLKEAVFVAPEHRGHVTVQDEAILIGQSFAVGGARYDVANPGIAQAREEFDVARASSLLQ